MTFQSFENQFAQDTFSPLTREIESSYLSASYKFNRILHSSLFFHLSYLTLILFELVGVALTLSNAPKSPLMAILLAGIFLTGFTYLILIYYFQAKRPGQYREILLHFFESTKHREETYPKMMEKTLSLIDTNFETFSTKVQLLHTLLCETNRLFNGRECVKFKEMLLQRYLQTLLHSVSTSPMDPEVHSKLVHGFIMLADLFTKSDKAKYSSYLHKSVEELYILKSLMPDDPWVFAQLASCFHKLELFDREVLMYEKLLDMDPGDEKVLFRLGCLYFRHGQLAKGLEVYQSLFSLDPDRASRLIDLYSTSFFTQEVDFKL